MGEAGGKYIHLSISLLLTWLFYLLVSVVELAAWVCYMVGEYAFPRFYFVTFGYWGSIVLYFLPPVFAIIHLTSELRWDLNTFPGSWTLVLAVVGGLLWIAHSLFHILLVKDFIDFVDGKELDEIEINEEVF